MTLTEAMAHNARVARVGQASSLSPAGEAREADLHEQIISECKRRGWYYVHSRMDRGTTTALGVPDFIIAAGGGHTYWVEAKSRTGKPTSEQLGAVQWLKRLGHQAAVVRSVEEFQAVIGNNEISESAREKPQV